MDIKNLENKFKIFKESINFNYSLKKLNWFNIGGNTKIYFKPNSLNDLIKFLKLYEYNKNLFVLGAGSNVLFKDDLFDGAVIKLSKNFSRISLLNENTIIAGSGVLDKLLSDFAMENSLSGFEFLSCIPGTIGGGIRMNSGCFESEFQDILVSVQYIDFDGIVKTINSKNINFEYIKTLKKYQKKFNLEESSSVFNLTNSSSSSVKPDEAVFTSMPSSFAWCRISADARSSSFAIWWIRFLAIYSSSFGVLSSSSDSSISDINGYDPADVDEGQDANDDDEWGEEEEEK